MTSFRQHIRALALILPLVAAGCTHVYRNHGYVPPQNDLALVQVGKTSQSELDSLIGRPSAQGVLTGSTWYYVGSRWDYFGAREPREVERRVVAISFNEQGVVQDVATYGLDHGRVIELSRRVTDSGIANVSIVRQLMGSIGRVSAGELLDQ
ncbi:outer membrane protein assembly factor BamE [Paracoccus sp. (in: a-proteobacteria)]|uniref:outer membrane protein assembly factor BamE n=1 Tax=Paracoccus sp. TaxID=267 RepID=UPI002896C3A2|nr:outer membrane protein assembly factor BamE [Paracoccus sp. (in: a-proteobacteria)]